MLERQGCQTGSDEPDNSNGHALVEYGAENRKLHRSAAHTALRISYPLRRLTSDAIAGQALGGFGGTVAGAGAGAAIMGVTSMIISRNKKFRAASISLGALIGGTLGSSLGGVSGAVTGLFVGVARLPFAIMTSISAKEAGKLITPLEKTARVGWKVLNNPYAVRERIKNSLNLKK
ncbi:hypothetical protein M3P05_00655 [Sansalvadorimonas sp. 2012CJ34-2]|uniref:Uncharacterized protein n=1 Tax=Parendozoicomonas callyspongiae TaxID=2942213 RepID=A0ABT0PAQ3_9GAMM|nr:hypothetical protein [Sansalvadorimonas sp. 2012CJ34-2]MCL6268460.1 hypothetical protein [Sansalvadorimonas sp. 2012CJ34-2]